MMKQQIDYFAPRHFVTLLLLCLGSPALQAQLIERGHWMPNITAAETVVEIEAAAIAVDGNRACVVGQGNGKTEPGLRVLDISDPANPQLKGSLAVGGAEIQVGIKVAISGNFAFVTGVGLSVIDISNLAEPRRVAWYSPSHNYNQVAISGGRVALARWRTDSMAIGWEVTIEILDITDPVNPKFLGEMTRLPGSDISLDGGALALVGNFAYVSFLTFGGAGVQVIDFSNPTMPNLAGQYWTDQMVRDIAQARAGFMFLPRSS